MAARVVVHRAKLDQLLSQLVPRSQDTVDQSAQDIQQLSYELAPKLTGALSQSIYVSTPRASDYSQHSSTAQSLNPLAQIEPEVTPNNWQSISGVNVDNAYTAIVGVAVNYGLFNELGTRYMAPRPFLFPSIEGNRDNFFSAMSHIADV